MKTRLLVALCSSFLLSACHDQATKTDKTVEITVATVQSKLIPEISTAYGSVHSYQDAVLSAQAAGVVEKIAVKNGQLVKQGQLLFRLDNNQAKAKLSVQQVALAEAKATLKRYQKLYQKNLISKQSFNEYMATYKEDVAKAKSSKAVLQYKAVIAPFNGYVEYRQVNLGDYVKAGQPLIRLVDTQDLYVGYALPSKYSALVKLGQSVKITIPAVKKTVVGKVTFVGKQVNTATRNFAIQASVPNSSEEIKPGMFAKVENLLNPNRKLLVIPASSVLTDLKGQYVYVIKGNKAQRVAIKTVIGSDNDAYVSSGLKAGQQVAVGNDQLLTNNVTVKVLTP